MYSTSNLTTVDALAHTHRTNLVYTLEYLINVWYETNISG